MNSPPRTRVSAERYNRNMEKIFQSANEIEAGRRAQGLEPNPNLNPPPDTPPRKGWSLAKGSAGFNVGGDVWGAYVKGVALFVFQTAGPPRPFFDCVVHGHLTCGGSTLDSAMVQGEAIAMQYGRAEADHVMSKKQFKERMENPARLPTYTEI